MTYKLVWTKSFLIEDKNITLLYSLLTFSKLLSAGLQWGNYWVQQVREWNEVANLTPQTAAHSHKNIISASESC